MAFQLSPGVLVREQDATNVVPSVATTTGGFVGDFSWGPAREIVSIDGENNLVASFGKPDDTTYQDFMTASSFLAYGSSLLNIREVGTAARNSISNGTAVLIRNESEYEASYEGGAGAVGMWAAKYAGALGNSLEVSFADYASFDDSSVASVTVTAGGTGYTSAPTVTFSSPPGAGTTTITAKGTAVLSGTAVSSIIITEPGFGYTSTPTVTLSAGGGSGATGTVVSTTAWTYGSNFDERPTSTSMARANGVDTDALHVIVVDKGGKFSGKAGTVLEKFSNLSKASDAKDTLNQTNFYKKVINNQSKYIWWMDHPGDADASDWGNTFDTVASTADKRFGFVSPGTAELTVRLTGGVTAAPAAGDLQSGYDLLANDELVDVQLIMAGGHTTTVGDYIIDNVAATRRDCMVFISPQKATCVNNAGAEATDIVAEITGNNYSRSEFAVMDSGWKYMFDKYNDQYRWIPLNGDIAGTCVVADAQNDPWFSPAGSSRGQIKNAVKLAWSPKKSERDTLFKHSINPVIGDPGAGIILFGDKTLSAGTGAFSRINVRRLFNTVEKAIATAAKLQLFEFNDAFTRGQFRSLIEPFLRDVQGRRGIYDFRVVCDETNNTAAVIDGNEFRADVFIKPARSINFITLTFVATRTGITFEELGA
tara:strand:- start:28485 stop:30440 length:1956 start_codon:yes stop_codon:yes gene_type:complete